MNKTYSQQSIHAWLVTTNLSPSLQFTVLKFVRPIRQVIRLLMFGSGVVLDHYVVSRGDTVTTLGCWCAETHGIIVEIVDQTGTDIAETMKLAQLPSELWVIRVCRVPMKLCQVKNSKGFAWSPIDPKIYAYVDSNAIRECDLSNNSSTFVRTTSSLCARYLFYQENGDIRSHFALSVGAYPARPFCFMCGVVPPKKISRTNGIIVLQWPNLTVTVANSNDWCHLSTKYGDMVFKFGVPSIKTLFVSNQQQHIAVRTDDGFFVANNLHTPNCQMRQLRVNVANVVNDIFWKGSYSFVSSSGYCDRRLTLFSPTLRELYYSNIIVSSEGCINCNETLFRHGNNIYHF